MRLARISSRVILFFMRISMKETRPDKKVARTSNLCKKTSIVNRPWVWLYMMKASRGRKTICHFQWNQKPFTASLTFPLSTAFMNKYTIGHRNKSQLTSIVLQVVIAVSSKLSVGMITFLSPPLRCIFALNTSWHLQVTVRHRLLCAKW